MFLRFLILACLNCNRAPCYVEDGIWEMLFGTKNVDYVYPKAPLLFTLSVSYFSF